MTKAINAGFGMPLIIRQDIVLGYVFGRRKDAVFKKLKALREPFGIRHYYTDDWAAYSRYLDEAKHHIGKRNTQKIERKHLTLRTHQASCKKNYLFFNAGKDDICH